MVYTLSGPAHGYSDSKESRWTQGFIEHVECLSVHNCAILRLIRRLIFETLVGVYGLRIARGLSYEIGQGLYEPHARRPADSIVRIVQDCRKEIPTLEHRQPASLGVLTYRQLVISMQATQPKETGTLGSETKNGRRNMASPHISHSRF